MNWKVHGFSLPLCRNDFSHCWNLYSKISGNLKFILESASKLANHDSPGRRSLLNTIPTADGRKANPERRPKIILFPAPTRPNNPVPKITSCQIRSTLLRFAASRNVTSSLWIIRIMLGANAAGNNLENIPSIIIGIKNCIVPKTPGRSSPCEIWTRAAISGALVSENDTIALLKFDPSESIHCPRI